MKDPFEPIVFHLRVPLKQGEAEYQALTLQPPVLKDIVAGDGYPVESVSFARAMLSSLTGIPEVALNRIVPEDWADLRVLLSQSYQRFTGGVNLLDKKDDKDDPTEAAVKNIPPLNSLPAFAE
jgi:hypothetical protein